MWLHFLQLWRAYGWMRLGLNAAMALVLGLLICWAGFALLRHLTRGHPVASDVARRAAAPLLWLLPLLLLSMAIHTTLQAPQSALPSSAVPLELLKHLLLIALIVVLTWLIFRCIGALETVTAGQYHVDVADNLHARRALTQVRVLSRTAKIIITLLGVGAVLITIPGVQQLGTSLLASAGVAGLAVGLAARPVLSNLIAGLQIAITQPIRLDDVVVIKGEWGRIEEITGTYVVVCIWDERRLVVPLNWFMENPFQNWTRSSAEIIGSVYLWLDYRTPIEPLRDELKRICDAAPEWDRRVCVLQVTDSNERAIQVRALASSIDSGRSWDMRCRVREGLIDFVQREYPHCLPQMRAQMVERTDPDAPDGQPQGAVAALGSRVEKG